jgi:hypothetical protein
LYKKYYSQISREREKKEKRKEPEKERKDLKTTPGHGGRKAVPLFTHAESLFSVHFPDLCKAATNRLDLQDTDDKHAPVQTKAADAASGRQVRKSGAERKSQIAAEKK